MTTFQWKLRLAAAAALACALAQAGSAFAQPAARSAEVERGRYLVQDVAGCNDCHTQMTPNGPDMVHSLQGGPLSFQPLGPMPWAPVAPPIAGGPKGFTRAQFVSFLQAGKRPDGTSPLPPMPAFRLSEPDARAVVAYIMSLPHAPD